MHKIIELLRPKMLQVACNRTYFQIGMNINMHWVWNKVLEHSLLDFQEKNMARASNGNLSPMNIFNNIM